MLLCPVIFVTCCSPTPCLARFETAEARTEWFVTLHFVVSIPIFLAASDTHVDIWFLPTGEFLYHPLDVAFCQVGFGVTNSLSVLIKLVLFPRNFLNNLVVKQNTALTHEQKKEMSIYLTGQTFGFSLLVVSHLLSDNFLDPP